jgi:hypothetical protein
MVETTSGISGLGIAVVLGGGILVWSGVRGYTVTATLHSILSGQQPKNLPNENPVSLGGLIPGGGILGRALGIGSPGTGTGPGGKTPQKAFVIGSGQGRAWAKSFLATLGMPQTEANINSIQAWIHAEGGGGQNNPLNTTQAMPGSTCFNDVCVRNYPSIAVGLLGNAKALTNGLYGDIISALKSGQGLCGRSFQGLSTWSGGGYSSVC